MPRADPSFGGHPPPAENPTPGAMKKRVLFGTRFLVYLFCLFCYNLLIRLKINESATVKHSQHS